MSQPTASGVHLDYALTNVSVAYMQQAENFVGAEVFPSVPVDHQTNKYWTMPKNDWMRDDVKPRGPASESAGTGLTLSTDSYYCDVFAIHVDVPDQVQQNADASIDAEANAARLVATKMLIKNERQWVSDAFKTGVWGTDVVGGTDFTKWDVPATSDPIIDIEKGRVAILSTTGFLPNTLVLGYNVYSSLLNHPAVIDRIKQTSADAVTADILARYFRVDRLLVSQAVYATNNEGETAAYAFAAGKNAWLGYVNPAPAIDMPSAGYRFVWDAVTDGAGGQSGVGTVRIPMPLKRAVRVESQAAWDNKIVAPDLGYFFSAAVS